MEKQVVVLKCLIQIRGSKQKDLSTEYWICDIKKVPKLSQVWKRKRSIRKKIEKLIELHRIRIKP